MERRPDTDTALIDLLYGEADEAARASAQARLESDPGLAGELEQMRALRGSLAAWREETEPAPTGGLDELMAAARAQARGSQRVAAAAEPPGPQDQRSLLDRITAWFAPLLAHPGMAAAATLVLVVGVAGTLYLTRGVRSTSPTASADLELAPAETAPAETAAVPEAPAPAAATAPEPPRAPVADSAARSRATAGAAVATPPAEAVAERRAAKQEAAKPEPKAKRRAEPKPSKADADLFMDSADVVGTAAGGVGESAPPPPPPPPAAAPSRKPAPTPAAEPAPTPVAEPTASRDEESMVKPRSAGPSEVEQNLREAQAAARKGQCGIVRKLSERVRSLDAAFHRQRFAADRDIAACLAPVKK